MSDYERCVKFAYKDRIDAIVRGPLKTLSSDKIEQDRHIADYIMNEYSQVDPYVERILGYVAKSATIFLVVDNVDQIEDTKTQRDIFTECMTIAHKIKCNVVIAMRESTYARNKFAAVFDAYEFDSIVVEPPPILAVLSKRFFLARQLLQSKSAQFVSENGVKIKINNLATIIDMLQPSVLDTEVVCVGYRGRKILGIGVYR